jgi:hypothetical protein
VSPKSTIFLDTLAFKSIEKSAVIENYLLSSIEKEEIAQVQDIYFLGKLQKVF